VKVKGSEGEGSEGEGSEGEGEGIEIGNGAVFTPAVEMATLIFGKSAVALEEQRTWRTLQRRSSSPRMRERLPKSVSALASTRASRKLRTPRSCSSVSETSVFVTHATIPPFTPSPPLPLHLSFHLHPLSPSLTLRSDPPASNSAVYRAQNPIGPLPE
jgi:hypothetical protein